ncbi:pollen-specific leucine-rich repeat extensin-like protein 3 [Iris pallida]|uniref:Pollen-specific leucine-rich repeat extensin-like protein 3 n=1 Tax=Iris pallida TaxID=29817 RepID=A0AAX6EC86_IRIPA|nr:pollen-specific leucine-rich repeat extensin-like protein 3 [Iris pallida]KAJ6808119.1 pollen-specific leucine-rich repeat extensin-like protein 3 [Iris pallida]
MAPMTRGAARRLKKTVNAEVAPPTVEEEVAPVASETGSSIHPAPVASETESSLDAVLARDDISPRAKNLAFSRWMRERITERLREQRGSH